jgi:gamma-glutamyl phosphate reductase
MGHTDWRTDLCAIYLDEFAEIEKVKRVVMEAKVG